MMKPRTANSLLMDFIKEQPMDAKTTATPLFKEEHVGKTVKPKALTPSEPGYRDRAKFVALAQKRMNKAIKAIREVGKLDRRSGYTDDDVEEMSFALETETKRAFGRLMAKLEGEPDFQLGGEGEG